MKTLLPLLLLTLAGCQAGPNPVSLSAPIPPPTTTVAVPQPPDAFLERKVRRQAQYIEALVSQNEALAAGLDSSPVRTPYPSPVARALLRPQATTTEVVEASPAPPPEAPMLTPNADGVIDLAAVLVAPMEKESVNPFAVRTAPAGSAREVSLQLGGIVAGPVACAVINDRLVQAGDLIESLAVERIEADAVILKRGALRLRLPLGGKTLRVRLPI